MVETHEGGCLCGAVRYRVTGEPVDIGYCHCRMCQKNTGSPAVVYASFKSADFSWIAGEVSKNESSPDCYRQFCARCGSYVAFSTGSFPSEISVNVGSLDNPEDFPPRRHIFIESRISWFDPQDGLPRVVGYGPPPED